MKKSSALWNKVGFLILLAVCAGFPAMSAEVSDFGIRRHDLRLSVSSPSFFIEPIVHADGWRQVGRSSAQDIPRFTPPHPSGMRQEFVVSLKSGLPRTVNGLICAKECPDGSAEVECSFAPTENGRVATFALQGGLDDDAFRNGRIVVDGKAVQIPDALGKGHPQMNFKAKTLKLESQDGKRFIAFDFASVQPFSILFPSTGPVCTLRIIAATGEVAAGKVYGIAFAMRTDGGLRDVNAPWTARAGDRFVPLAYRADIKEGSALDFSGIVPRDPCGSHGRLRVKGAHFEFKRLLGVRQKFYGINLHSHACTNTLEEARTLVGRFVKMGYNAVRFHNFENGWMGLTCGSPDASTPVPERFEGIDNLVAALRERGMYLTVDMHVGRRMPYRLLGIDKPGEASGNEMKYLYLTNAKARESLKKLIKGFLSHVNPHTGNRYADEPTLMLLSVVNEGPCGWRNSKGEDNLCALEDAFFREMRSFIKDEVGSDIPLTNMNGGGSYFCQEETRAELFDYVDWHFYYDHPRFPENAKWQNGVKLPFMTGNRRVFAERESSMDWMWARVWGKPYVITEFNWCAPSLYRSWAGVVLGATAALQDWDGMWRYLWSHDHTRSLNPGNFPIYRLEGASDPLAQAAERAAMCLFLRGDMKPLDKSAAIVMDSTSVDIGKSDHVSVNLRDAKWSWAGWYARLGTAVGTPPDGVSAQFKYPDVNPSASDVEKSLGIGKDTRTGDGRVSIDYGRNAFSVNTPKTCGVVMESGTMKGGILEVDAGNEITALWASSLDGRELRSSGRILLTHLTSLYNTGDRFADLYGMHMVATGKPPYLMPRAKAKVALSVDAPEAITVYALDTDGTRRFTVPTSVSGGRLSFVCATDRDEGQATYLYELVRR